MPSAGGRCRTPRRVEAASVGCWSKAMSLSAFSPSAARRNHNVLSGHPMAARLRPRAATPAALGNRRQRFNLISQPLNAGCAGLSKISGVRVVHERRGGRHVRCEQFDLPHLDGEFQCPVGEQIDTVPRQRGGFLPTFPREDESLNNGRCCWRALCRAVFKGLRREHSPYRAQPITRSAFGSGPVGMPRPIQDTDGILIQQWCVVCAVAISREVEQCP
jgi:hypothetical protein